MASKQSADSGTAVEYRVVNVHSEPVCGCVFYNPSNAALCAIGYARRTGDIAFILSEHRTALVFPDATEAEVLTRLASGPVASDDEMKEWSE